MELGRRQKMINFAPLDAEPAPIETITSWHNTTQRVYVPAAQFDELVETLDEADEAPTLAAAAELR